VTRLAFVEIRRMDGGAGIVKVLLVMLVGNDKGLA